MNPPLMMFTELIKDVESGNVQSRIEFYERLVSKFRTVCKRKLRRLGEKSEDAIEDLFSTVLRLAYKKIDSGQISGSPELWEYLTGFAGLRAVTIAKRRRNHSIMMNSMLLPEDQYHDLHDAEFAEQLEFLRSIIRKKRIFNDVVDLSLKGMDNSEIASELGVDPYTITRRKDRICSIWRDAISEC